MFYYYLIAVNILAFALMGIDKYKAQHHLWRIPDENPLSFCHHRWFCGCHLRYEPVSPQDETLVFCLRHAADSFYSGRSLVLVFHEITVFS